MEVCYSSVCFVYVTIFYNKRVLKYTLNHSETHCFIFGIFISGYFSLHFFHIVKIILELQLYIYFFYSISLLISLALSYLIKNSSQISNKRINNSGTDITQTWFESRFFYSLLSDPGLHFLGALYTSVSFNIVIYSFN